MNNLQYIALGSAGIAILIVLIFGWFAVQRAQHQDEQYRRSHDDDTDAEYQRLYDEGLVDGKGKPRHARIEIWTDLHRDEHREKQRNITLRIVDH